MILKKEVFHSHQLQLVQAEEKGPLQGDFHPQEKITFGVG